MPEGGERTWVVDLESGGACGRWENFPVALTLLAEGPYGEVDVVLEDV